MNILLALVALSFLILVHELGHFLMARRAGIKVLEFSIFMGPKLFSWKRGETEYSVRAIPMGGFVKMEGEEEASDDERAFNKKPAGIRAIVVAAGATMNILIAIIIIAVISLSLGYYTNVVSKVDNDSAFQKAGILPGDKIISYGGKRVFHPNDLLMYLYVSKGESVEVAYRREGVNGVQRVVVTPQMTAPVYLIGVAVGGTEGQASSTIQQVEKGSPAETAGFLPGDIIKKVDDVIVNERNDLLNYLQQTRDKPVDITVDRNGDTITMHGVKPRPSETYYDLGADFEYEKGGFFKSIASSISYSVSTIQRVIFTLGWLFTGDISFRDVSGPVGIVTYIGDVVDMGRGFSEKLFYLLETVAFLSLNLGVMNLLPFPALDGGKLILILVEKIRRKALPPEKEAWISMVGFFLLIILLIATLVNDIPRAVERIIRP